jgi:transcriptional regulator with XRE-family HTH domain
MIEALGKIGEVIKQRRLSVPLTLQELARKTGISASHLGRIERGQRFPSGRVLHKIASPLGYAENELFMLAGYLTPQTSGVSESVAGYTGGFVDPVVIRYLSVEPVEVQRQVISILGILKSLAKANASHRAETSTE